MEIDYLKLLGLTNQTIDVLLPKNSKTSDCKVCELQQSLGFLRQTQTYNNSWLPAQTNIVPSVRIVTNLDFNKPKTVNI